MSKNCGATPLDAGPQFFLTLILGAPGRRIEQSLNAPRANGSSAATVSPLHFTRQARPTSGSICRFSGPEKSGLSAGSSIASLDSGNSPRKVSEPGAYHGKMPFGTDPSLPSVLTFRKSASLAGLLEMTREVTGHAEPEPGAQFGDVEIDHGSSTSVPT